MCPNNLGTILKYTTHKLKGNDILFSLLKESQLPDRERQIYDIAYMWNLKKMVQMNLLTK